MSERMAKKKRGDADLPQLNQEQRAALECVHFIETRLTGRPMEKVISIIVDTVVHLMLHAEVLTEQPKGNLVRALGNLLVSMADSMQAPTDDAEIIDAPVVNAVENPETTETHEEQ